MDIGWGVIGEDSIIYQTMIDNTEDEYIEWQNEIWKQEQYNYYM